MSTISPVSPSQAEKKDRKDKTAESDATKNEATVTKSELKAAARQAKMDARAAKKNPRLDPKFITAKNEFLMAEGVNAQHAAIKNLSGSRVGREYLLEALDENGALDSKLRLRAYSDILENTYYNANTQVKKWWYESRSKGIEKKSIDQYRQAMKQLPFAVHTHSIRGDAFSSIQESKPSFSQVDNFKTRLEKIAEESQTRKPIKSQRKLVKALKGFVSDLEAASTLSRNEKSDVAAQTLKVLVDHNASWFNVEHPVDSLTAKYRQPFNIMVKELLQHI